MRFLSWTKKEIIIVFPAIVYFAIAFNFIHFTERLLLTPGQTSHYTYLSVTIAALIVGKVLIITNYFPWVNAFPNRPLIYNIIWKSIIYALFIFIIRISETFITNLYYTRNLESTFSSIHELLTDRLFWCTESWIFVVFFGYIIFTEFMRVLGKPKIMRLLFG